MRRSSSKRSTTPSRTEPRGPARRGADVYLMPSVIGGGRGDAEEVLSVGRALARDGFPVHIVRSRPLSVLDDRSFDWSGLRRARGLRPRADRAVTISSQFGITAADGRDEPLGRAGPWAVERVGIERAYGPARVLHISLEEFARARPVAALAEERWRESGRTERHRRARRTTRAFRREVAEFARLYRKFRAFDRPDLLVAFPTFRRSARFAAEFPEAVQTGPIWPEGPPPQRAVSRAGPFRVLWYASPSTADRLAPRLIAGLAAADRPVRLRVRSPRPLPLTPSGRVQIEAAPTRPAAEWRREWARTDLAIVTGTRSLLEAIRWGVPFLYFNGVMGHGRSTRRHRPEKLLALLAVMPGPGTSARVRRDLSEFSRLRGVEEIVVRWVRRPVVIGPIVRRAVGRGFAEPFTDGARFVAAVAERFASGSRSPAELVRSLQRESRRAHKRPVARVSKV